MKKSLSITLIPISFVMLACFSSVSPAQTSGDLDMTMTIMEDEEQPEGFIQKIPLPSAEDTADAPEQMEPDVAIDSETLEDVESLTSELADDATGVINDSVKDIISIDGAGELPDDIVDNLSDDSPLLDDLTDDVDDTLPNDLTDDAPLDNAIRETASEIDNIVDNIDDANSDMIDDSIEDTLDDSDLKLDEMNETVPEDVIAPLD